MERRVDGRDLVGMLVMSSMCVVAWSPLSEMSLTKAFEACEKRGSSSNDDTKCGAENR